MSHYRRRDEGEATCLCLGRGDKTFQPVYAGMSAKFWLCVCMASQSLVELVSRRGNAVDNHITGLEISAPKRSGL